MPEPRHNKGKSKQDYETPDDFIAAVKRRYSIEEFDCDLAASAENTKAPCYHDIDSNSLIQNWKIGDGWNWLNPPFADIRPWVEKAYAEWIIHGAMTLVLLPAGVGSNWFRDFVYEKATLILLNNRIHFVGAEFTYPKDLILVEYGPRAGCGVGPWGDIHIWAWQR